MAFVATYTKAVITNYFGTDVGTIAEALCAGPKPIPLLYRKVVDQLRDKKLFRKQLTLLYWNHIVDVQYRNGVEWYSITFDNVFRFAMLPSMLTVLELLAGPGSFILVKNFVKYGRLTCSDAIRLARDESNDVEYDFVKIFADLAKDRVLMRTKNYAGESEEDPFLTPPVILDGDSRIARLTKIKSQMVKFEEQFMEQLKNTNSSQRAAKLERLRRQKRRELIAEADKIESSDSDANILWKINFNILDRIYRDRLLIESLIKDAGIDEAGEKIMRAAFSFCMKLQEGNASGTNGKLFSRNDLEKILMENPDIRDDDFEATLYLISSCADGFIIKIGQSAGGLYGLDYELGLKILATKTIISMIDSKYENNEESEERKGLPAYIFSTLLKKGLVEEEKLAVIFKHPEDELRNELYKMRKDGFIHVVTRDSSYEFNPSNSHFLYGVDILKVARSQLQCLLQFQANYITRRLHEKNKIISVKMTKEKIRKMTDYAKQSCNDEEELSSMLEDINAEMDQSKRKGLRRYRQFRDYLKKVEMMLNESIWVIYRFIQMEERRRKDMGVSNTKRIRKRPANEYEGDPEPKRLAL